jgi:hypothetical protein
MDFLKSLPRIKVFVIDALNKEMGVYSHMGLGEALNIIKILNPVKAYLIGMTCSIGDHEKMNEELRIISERTELAFDGMLLEGFAL